jgi:hypothetical protein
VVQAPANQHFLVERAQITQICTHTGGTLTRQPEAQIGGSGARRE